MILNPPKIRNPVPRKSNPIWTPKQPKIRLNCHKIRHPNTIYIWKIILCVTRCCLWLAHAGPFGHRSGAMCLPASLNNKCLCVRFGPALASPVWLGLQCKDRLRADLFGPGSGAMRLPALLRNPHLCAGLRPTLPSQLGLGL